MDEKQEQQWRRKAIRLWLQGFSDRDIQRQVWAGSTNGKNAMNS